MALIWIDGFDHYGAGSTPGTDNMLAGVYAAVTAGVSPSTSTARTGTHSLVAATGNNVRRILGAPKTGVGFGMACFLSALPSGTDNGAICIFSDASAAGIVSITMDATGKIRAKLGGVGGTLLGQTASPVLVAGAYQHVEVFCKISATVGVVQVRVNEVMALNLTGLNTGTVSIENVEFIGAFNGWVDDIFCWDDTGASNNTFIGGRRVFTVQPDADTVVADFAIVGATTGWDAINDAAPDGDTSYIVASPLSGPPKVSEFDLSSLPSGITAINGMQSYVNAKKTDAGGANLKASVLSAAAVAAGIDRPITTTYAYCADVFEVDPNTGAPWTSTAINDCKLRLERTA